MDWTSFLIQVASRGTGAAAGAAALPAGPVASAAAGALTGASAERLLGEFLQAQASQLQRIEALNRDLQGRLVGLEGGIETLLTAPLRRARLHVEEAQRKPTEQRGELTLARNALYEAWSLVEDDLTRRIVVAQQLSIVFALLDDADAARRWLVTSYVDTTGAVRAQADIVQQMIETQVGEATHMQRSDKLRVVARSSKGLAGDTAFIATGYGVWALASPKYRRRLSRLKAEQKAIKASLTQQRVGKRVQAVRGPLADEARAVMELQRDADTVREACRRLGATDAEIPAQELQVAAAENDVLQIRVVSAASTAAPY